jgi:hypothetical protein
MRTRASLSLTVLCVFGWAVPCQAAPQPKYEMTGKWTSSRGPINMQQSGNDLSGTCVLSSGQMAKFQGKMDGDKISFTWSIGDKPVGSGTLSAADKGAKWSGPYTDSTKGAESTFTLTRPPQPKTTVPKGQVIDVTGHWLSEHGPFEFQQTGNNVTGSWNAMKIIPVQIAGTMNRYEFEFTMEMSDTEAGKGSLTLSGNQQTMQGIIELQGRPPLRVNLKRDER